MRFTNNQIYYEFDAVVEQIMRYEDDYKKEEEDLYIIG